MWFAVYANFDHSHPVSGKAFQVRILRSSGFDQPLEQGGAQVNADAHLLEYQRARRVDQCVGDLDIAVDWAGVQEPRMVRHGRKPFGGQSPPRVECGAVEIPAVRHSLTLNSKTDHGIDAVQGSVD